MFGCTPFEKCAAFFCLRHFLPGRFCTGGMAISFEFCSACLRVLRRHFSGRMKACDKSDD